MTKLLTYSVFFFELSYIFKYFFCFLIKKKRNKWCDYLLDLGIMQTVLKTNQVLTSLHKMLNHCCQSCCQSSLALRHRGDAQLLNDQGGGGCQSTQFRPD